MAEEMGTCPVCGVPSFVTGEHAWLNNGEIVQARNQSNRLVLLECENIDPVFRIIERMIGFSIERIIITAMRRAVRSYVKQFVPADARRGIARGELDPVPVFTGLTDVARYFGYGRIEPVEVRSQEEPADCIVTDLYRPFSVAIVAATLQGAVEAIVDKDRDMSYLQLFPGAFRVTMVKAPIRWSSRAACS